MPLINIDSVLGLGNTINDGINSLTNLDANSLSNLGDYLLQSGGWSTSFANEYISGAIGSDGINYNVNPVGYNAKIGGLKFSGVINPLDLIKSLGKNKPGTSVYTGSTGAGYDNTNISLANLSSIDFGPRYGSMQLLLNNIQLANRFECIIFSPTAAPGLFNIREDSFRIKSVSLSSAKIDVSVVNYDGRSKEVATGKTLDSLTVTFYDSNMGMLREKFNSWMTLIMNKDTGKLGFYDDYIAPWFVVDLVSFEDINQSKGVWFEAIYPIDVGDIQLNRDSSNIAVEFNVTFSYRNVYYDNEVKSK